MAKRPFLGVNSSVTGKFWRDRLDERVSARALAIAQQSGLSDLISRILAGREVAPDDAEKFLDPTLRGLLPEPFTLTAMEAATQRLVAAILHRETMAIFGDYDVDGACSARRCWRNFWTIAERRACCTSPTASPRATAPTAKRSAPSPARARSCWSRWIAEPPFEPFAEAKKLGVDVIALDHHQAPEILPDAIVVNPNRQDDMSGQGALCAAGVVFLALVAVNRALRKSGYWREFGRNPTCCWHRPGGAGDGGGRRAPHRPQPRLRGQGPRADEGAPASGLRALADIAGVNGPPRAYHLGFLLGPRINAGGRIGDAALGAGSC